MLIGMGRRENFYHGTGVSLKPGEKVLPADVHGMGAHYGHLGSSGHAYATTDEQTAWQFAANAEENTGKRGRVYDLKSNSKAQIGPFNKKHSDYWQGDKENLDEHIAPSWTVKGQHDIMPGRQGTIPINWRQFQDQKSQSNTKVNVNHPTPGDVLYGHKGSQALADSQAERKRKARAPAEDKPHLFVHEGQGRLF